MQSARAIGTDERLDELSDRVDRGFDRVDRNFDKVDRDIRDLRTEMNAGDAALRAEIADLGKTIRWFGAMLILMLAAALVQGQF